MKYIHHVEDGCCPFLSVFQKMEILVAPESQKGNVMYTTDLFIGGQLLRPYSQFVTLDFNFPLRGVFHDNYVQSINQSFDLC